MFESRNTATPPSEEALNEANNEAHDRQPGAADWGFFSHGDGPAVCGGGVGAFCWFKDREATHAHIRDYFSWWPMVIDDGNPDKEHIGREVCALYEDTSLTADDAALVEAINAVMSGEFQIAWCGSFAELVGSVDEFAASVRSTFWEAYGDEEDDGSDRPIPEEKMNDFLKFVRDYGA
jgi:hypothetical protein